MPTKGSTASSKMSKVLVGVTFLAVTLFVSVNGAGAKGPESVTITGPGIEQPIELISPSNLELITRLMEQTGLWYANANTPRPLEAPAGELGPGYTLAWVNSGPPDESIEARTINQVIYLDAEAGPVIHTPAQKSLQGWASGVIGWHMAPGELRDTLAELGVPGIAAPRDNSPALNDQAFQAARPEREPDESPGVLGIAGFALFFLSVGALGLYSLKRRRGTS